MSDLYVLKISNEFNKCKLCKASIDCWINSWGYIKYKVKTVSILKVLLTCLLLLCYRQLKLVFLVSNQ